MNTAPIDLEALVGKEDRAVFVAALQALWRERVSAKHAIECVAEVEGVTPSLADEVYGISKVDLMLKRVGAAPLR